MSEKTATAIGLTSILQWGAQALISTCVTDFPPFQTMFMTFLVAFAVMGAKWACFRESPFAYARHPLHVWAVGVCGLFGYYSLFYLALENAPAAEVTLLANCWPLLMTLFTGFLPSERLRWFCPAPTG